MTNCSEWDSSTIAHILRKNEYLGHTVNFKTRKHFKDKKSHYVDKDQWLIFEGATRPVDVCYAPTEAVAETRQGR